MKGQAGPNDSKDGHGHFSYRGHLKVVASHVELRHDRARVTRGFGRIVARFGAGSIGRSTLHRNLFCEES